MKTILTIVAPLTLLMIPPGAARLTAQAPATPTLKVAADQPADSDGQDSPDTDDEQTKPAKRNWSEQVAASVEKFQLLRDDQAKPLQMVRAYQWANPARPNVLGERLCLLWVSDGRPVASCKIYPTGKSIVHAFVSMTDKPIFARQGETAIWSPPPTPLEFKPIAKVPPPHDSASRRRIQMKGIAREFTAATGPGEAERQKAVPELRLLPTPLYRYPAGDDGKDGIVDGSVFCFVVGGGNPQMFLILEAVRESGVMRWQYAFSRRTNAKLTADLQGERVWNVAVVRRGDMTSTGDFYKIALPVR